MRLAADLQLDVQLRHREPVAAEEAQEPGFEVASREAGGLAKVDQRFAQGLVAASALTCANCFGQEGGGREAAVDRLTERPFELVLGDHGGEVEEGAERGRDGDPLTRRRRTRRQRVLPDADVAIAATIGADGDVDLPLLGARSCHRSAAEQWLRTAPPPANRTAAR
jgi:hypothetical protein